MDTAERRATAALWSIQGIGPVTLGEVREQAGPLGELLERPVTTWAPRLEWRDGVLERVLAVGSLARRADWVEQWAREWNARVLFPGDRAFPSKLLGIPKQPALLFAQGPAGDAQPKRRIAIVGTRRLDKHSLGWVSDLAGQAAGAGLGLVSGAALGVDQAAHGGSLARGGENWAFLGSALDEIDFAQREVCRRILEENGTLFSEFPPGFRSNRNSFTLRNRLISGASDAVLVYRAPADSGALHTANAAQVQGRPLLATPGDPWNETCAGSNALLQSGKATPGLDLADLLKAVGLEGSFSPLTPEPVDLSDLSEVAKEVFDVVCAGPTDFEGLLEALPSIDSGRLSAVLVELEVFGAVIHKGGRRYEKR